MIRHRLDPLEALLRISEKTDSDARPYDPFCVAHEMAEACGVSTRTWQRWKVNGLTDHAADEAATRLGLHPSAIWPDYGQQAFSARDERWYDRWLAEGQQLQLEVMS